MFPANSREDLPTVSIEGNHRVERAHARSEQILAELDGVAT
jgi:hypothetical protein